MLYEIIPWIRFLVSEVGIVWRDAQGILVALDEHPLVASDGQVRGRGVSGRVESGRWEREGERTGRGLHVPLPVREHAGEHVTVLSEWMGGSSVRNNSRGV